MPLEPTDHDLVEASKALRVAQAFNVKDLQRPDLGDELNFKMMERTNRLIVGLLRSVEIEKLIDLPREHVSRITQYSNSANDLFTNIKDFSALGGGDTAERRNQLLSHGDSLYNQMANDFVPIVQLLDHLYPQSKSRSSLQREMQKELAGMKALHAEGVKSVTAIKALAGEGGTVSTGKEFETAASRHLTTAGKWRNGTIAAVSLLLAYVLSLLIWPNLWHDALGTDQYPESIQRGLSKFLVFVTLSYGVYMCVRNFFAHQHNAIVNQHRHNALRTHQALAEAAHDTGNKDTILTHAAACIFAPQPTGYTKDSSEGLALPSNSIIGLVKTANET
ncbi:hypothetical protein [Candidatus Palauibacter irciniicola]|uniref:hypothetical protein n=1 Tax=Candidatus Palauibacter irciniicola TaxID=3056733 RepID=UPI003B013166